jgi:glycosyltransferase involved in cell wall biosynthesis
MRRLHIAVLDEELPYPLTSGKRIRTLNLLGRLARRHRVTYLCHRNAGAAEARRAADHLTEVGIAARVVERAVPAKSGPRFYARLAGNLLSPLPYSVATHTSPALRAAMDLLQAEDPVDLWHCEWTPYAELLRGRPAARWLVMAHNVESLIWQRYCETEANPAKRWYIRGQWRKFERFERWAYSAATHTVAVSPDDATLIRSRFGAGRVSVVDNGVDVGYFQPAPSAPPRDPRRILFLGSLDWRPNLDGVRLLLDRVLPAVWAAEPAARLLLVGRQPPDWLRRAAAEHPGVELHADVPDVRPFLARCGMLAVPLRVGGGSRLKILEALASGLPVVSTRVGAEGLELEAGRHLTVVESVEGMAVALVEAVRSPDRLREQADCGRAAVVRRYDWDLLAERLDAVWRECAGERPAEERRVA